MSGFQAYSTSSNKMSKKEFEHIFKSYYSDIYNFIYHYIMDADEAKDLVQNVFISLFENYKKLPETTNIKGYLLSMSKNCCISYLRHRNVIDHHALKYFESLIFSASSKYDTTYDDLFLQLNVAMDKLSPLQKQIICMKLEGKSYAEMSAASGATLSQIHKNIKKAYDKIRQSAGTPDTAIISLIFMRFLSHRIL